MSHNFQKGIDHTTGLDLPNHYFIDGGCYNNPGGIDLPTSGSSSTPYLTLDYAISQTSSGDTLVFSGKHDLSAPIPNRNLISDTLRKGIINDPTNSIEPWDLSTAGRVSERVTFTNFASITVNQWFYDCVFKDCGIFKKGGVPVCERTVFVNTDIDVGTGTFEQCWFYSSRFINSSASGTTIVENCYLNADCVYIKNPGNGAIQFQGVNYIYDKAVFENGDNTGINYLGVIREESTHPTLLSSPSYFDLGVQAGSSLILGVNNVGNAYVSMGLSPDNPALIDAINANPDIELINSEIVVNTSTVSIGQTVELGPFRFTASARRARLSRFYDIGINDFCHYEVEARTADIGEDINTATYYKYKQGERMTKDDAGRSTGDPLYNWGINNFVDYKDADILLKITRIV